MLVKNLEAAKELVKKYRSISLQDIKNVVEDKGDQWYNMESILHNITGFGDTKTCMLCKAIGNVVSYGCAGCIYYNLANSEDCRYPCTSHPSYEDIEDASDPYDLFLAIRRRADYLENLINEVENDN